jgi:hypothetical protein
MDSERSSQYESRVSGRRAVAAAASNTRRHEEAAPSARSCFSIQGRCRAPDECFEPTGIRITFVPATTAAGVRRGSIQTGVMFDAQNTPISTPVPSAQFVGYKSAVPIDHAEFKRIFAGASLAKLVYRRCS